MATVSDTIPDGLRPEVDAALAWFNREQPVRFEVTGIVDADLALASEGPRELRLVLCGGDRCEQRSFRVSPAAEGFAVAPLDETPDVDERPAELDPPPGALRGWLERTHPRHAFTVVLFYRGFW